MKRFALVQLFSLVPAVVYPFLAAKKDFFQIEMNGKYDSLKAGFHSINVWIRVLVFFSIGLLAQLPYVLSGKSLLLFVTYQLLTAALFWLLFDWQLNKLRGLPANYFGQNAKSDKLHLSIIFKVVLAAVLVTTFLFVLLLK